MKCPDCGSRLSEIMAEGILCHRCFKCGGFFAGSNVVNRLTSATVNTWRRIKIDSVWLTGGKGMCPQDGTMLQKYMGDAVPGNIDVKRCIRCGKWWFPGDSLHEFKPAQEAKSLYFRLWGITQDAATLILPIIAGILVVGGLGASLFLVKNEQRVQVSAQQQHPQVVVQQGVPGELRIVVFDVDFQGVAAYRQAGQTEWITTTLVSEGPGMPGWYLRGLVPGEMYELVVAGRQVNVVAP